VFLGVQALLASRQPPTVAPLASIAFGLRVAVERR
jgi:hypothetical protein